MLKQLLRRPDFQRNPVKALWRRIFWRLRWRFNKDLWVLPLSKDLTIRASRCGAGALIYYQGFSEPDTADFILRFLKPGMVFLDIGAHIGEYTLLASQAVGPKGRVHAFEPNPEMFRLLCENVKSNRLHNVTLSDLAISDVDEETEFEVCNEPSISSLKSSVGSDKQRDVLGSIVVRSIALDKYWQDYETPIDLVKMDIEGAEILAFAGSKRILESRAANSPVWIFEYAPHNYARFKYQADDLFRLLHNSGYTILECGARSYLRPFVPFVKPAGTMNLIAAKDQDLLKSILNDALPQGSFL
jgi:FkbM family methyltransferase